MPTAYASSLPDLSVVIVNYNTAALLEACLRSLYAESAHIQLEVFVVDNASTDASCTMVREKFPDVQLIANCENVGFARANNQALQQAHGRYLLLLNSDTVILDSALEHMLMYMRAHPGVGMCGPHLFYPDMTHQESAYPFPSLRGVLAIYTGLYERLPTLGQWVAPEWISPATHKTRIADWCSGACLMISRACFEAIGGLDESFFMYYEDTDWCRHAAQCGWQIAYYAEAHVIHYLGGSQDALRGQYKRRIRELVGAMHYLRKWHGRLYAAAYRNLVRLCGLYRYWRRQHSADTPQELEFYLTLAFGHESRGKQ